MDVLRLMAWGLCHVPWVIHGHFFFVVVVFIYLFFVVLQGSLSWWGICVGAESGIYMKARTHVLPAEHCDLLSPVSGLNVVADRSTSEVHFLNL